MSFEEPTYSYKPRLMGPAYEFALSKDSLDWAIGTRSGRVSYPMIQHIRLGYKPTNMASSRFIAEIWPLNAAKIPVHSVSAQSLVDMADQGKDYARFIRELHRRVAAAKSQCVYEAGMPSWRWWPSAIVGVLTLFAVAYVVVQGIVAGQFWVAGVIALIGGWFMWQIWNIVMRNRPRTYSPDNIPADVLPASSEVPPSR
jgi:hypothetical protein